MWSLRFYYFDFFLSLSTTAGQAFVSFGSTHPSESSSLSESSDSDSSMATRRARIDATSWKAVDRSISFCSLFSTFRNLMPGNETIESVEVGELVCWKPQNILHSPSLIAFNKSFRESSTGGTIFLTGAFLIGVMMPLLMSPFAIGLYADGGLCGPSSGGKGGGGGGIAAFGGDCFGDN